jgi:hypothetical protein
MSGWYPPLGPDHPTDIGYPQTDQFHVETVDSRRLSWWRQAGWPVQFWPAGTYSPCLSAPCCQEERRTLGAGYPVRPGLPGGRLVLRLAVPQGGT